MEFVNIRIGNGDRFEFLFGKKMDFRSRHLLLQAAYSRRGEHNIAYGRKTDNKELKRPSFTEWWALCE